MKWLVIDECSRKRLKKCLNSKRTFHLARSLLFHSLLTSICFWHFTAWNELINSALGGGGGGEGEAIITAARQENLIYSERSFRSNFTFTLTFWWTKILQVTQAIFLKSSISEIRDKFETSWHQLSVFTQLFISCHVKGWLQSVIFAFFFANVINNMDMILIRVKYFLST